MMPWPSMAVQINMSDAKTGFMALLQAERIGPAPLYFSNG